MTYNGHDSQFVILYFDIGEIQLIYHHCWMSSLLTLHGGTQSKKTQKNMPVFSVLPTYAR
jgi:hypothetical protein